MLMMRARVQGHRWVDHPAAAVMEARVPGQWVDRPAAVVMEAREQGCCWIDHPAAAVMEARVQGRHLVDRPSLADSLLSEPMPMHPLTLTAALPAARGPRIITSLAPPLAVRRELQERSSSPAPSHPKTEDSFEPQTVKF
ncbi:hypothetical protein ACOMHN_045494 [Nucella lapillus]